MYITVGYYRSTNHTTRCQADNEESLMMQNNIEMSGVGVGERGPSYRAPVTDLRSVTFC